MRLRRFPAQESPKKRSRKILRKTTKIEYFRQPFLTFFPLLHRWRRQSPKLLLGVEGSDFQKAKDYTNDFRVLFYDCVGDRRRLFYL